MRAHLQGLLDAGLGPKRIAVVSGVAHGVISSILYGKWLADGTRRQPNRRVRPDTATRLLAIEANLDTLGATVVINGAGTTLRVQALVACGWSQARLAALLGRDAGNFGPVVHGSRDGVQVQTARDVRDLYDRLWNVAPPESSHRERIAASRARNHAQMHGWVPPLAWDDDTIDDPRAVAWYEDPDADTQDEKREAFIENVAFIAEHGETWLGLEQRLEQPRKQIREYLRRYGRRDLADRLDINSDLRESA